MPTTDSVSTTLPESATQLFRQKGVRITTLRLAALRLLRQSSRACTHASLEHTFGNQMDCVSLYRTLSTLTGTGFLQKVVDSKGNCLYFHERTTNRNSPSHVKLLSCETIVSLPAWPDNYLSAIRRFQTDRIHPLPEGTCDDCHELNKKPE